MGTVKTLSLSAVTGLVTVRVAVSGDEHCVPHCGVKVMVIRHEPPDASENGSPCAGTPPGPQLSVSVKLVAVAGTLANVNVTPLSAPPEEFARVTVCVEVVSGGGGG